VRTCTPMHGAPERVRTRVRTNRNACTRTHALRSTARMDGWPGCIGTHAYALTPSADKTRPTPPPSVAWAHQPESLPDTGEVAAASPPGLPAAPKTTPALVKGRTDPFKDPPHTPACHPSCQPAPCPPARRAAGLVARRRIFPASAPTIPKPFARPTPSPLTFSPPCT
jgi:hypothetical protein